MTWALNDARKWTARARSVGRHSWHGIGDRVELIASPDAVTIEVAQSKLRAAGIDATIVGINVPSTLPVLEEEAKVRLIVDSDIAEMAREALMNFSDESEEPSATNTSSRSSQQ